MQVSITLVDINPKMVKAWRQTFEENPEVQILEGSILSQNVSAWVSPTNSRGSMDGGLDAIIKKFLGDAIESRLQQQILRQYKGRLPVGHAVAVPTGAPHPTHLISTPTMTSSSEDISDTLNVALACAAAFQAIHMQNSVEPGSIRSVALPGLGANTGRVPAEICADLMWTGYSLFRRRAFDDFDEMRKALEAELGELGPVSGKTASTKAVAPNAGVPDDDDDDDDIDEDESDDAGTKDGKKNDKDFDDY